MDKRPALTASELEELARCNGTAPCACAQPDGVPCGDLGRLCEQCHEAVRFLEAQRDPVAAQQQPATGHEDPLVILPTEIGA